MHGFFKNKNTLAPSPRQNEAYVSLTTAVHFLPFKTALINFVVICQVALSLICNDVFIEMLQLLYPKVDKILPGCVNTLRQWILDAFEVRKRKLKQRLQRAHSKISFSFDLWTSTNHLALLGLVAHYIDESGHNQSVSPWSLFRISWGISMPEI